MNLDVDTFKSIYVYDIIETRQSTYQKKAEELVKTYNVHRRLEEHQINSLLRAMRGATDVIPVTIYISKRMERSPKEGWSFTRDGKKLGEVILEFINTEIAIDAQSVKNIRNDVTNTTIDSEFVERFIEEAKLSLTARFLSYFAAYYQFKKTGMRSSTTAQKQMEIEENV